MSFVKTIQIRQVMSIMPTFMKAHIVTSLTLKHSNLSTSWIFSSYLLLEYLSSLAQLFSCLSFNRGILLLVVKFLLKSYMWHSTLHCWVSLCYVFHLSKFTKPCMFHACLWRVLLNKSHMSLFMIYRFCIRIYSY